MPTVRDFSAEKRGDFHAHDLLIQKEAVSPEHTSPLQLMPSKPKTSGVWHNTFAGGVAALIVLGIVQILTSIVVFGLGSGNPLGVLVVVAGRLEHYFGHGPGWPVQRDSTFDGARGETKGQLLATCSTSLAKFYRVQVIIGLALVAVLVARIALMIPR